MFLYSFRFIRMIFSSSFRITRCGLYGSKIASSHISHLCGSLIFDGWLRLRSQNYFARQMRAFIIRYKSATHRWISLSEETRSLQDASNRDADLVARVHRHVSRAMTRDEFDLANDDISLRAADRVTMYGEAAEVRFTARMPRWKFYRKGSTCKQLIWPCKVSKSKWTRFVLRVETFSDEKPHTSHVCILSLNYVYNR